MKLLFEMLRHVPLAFFKSALYLIFFLFLSFLTYRLTRVPPSHAHEGSEKPQSSKSYVTTDIFIPSINFKLSVLPGDSYPTLSLLCSSHLVYLAFSTYSPPHSFVCPFLHLLHSDHSFSKHVRREPTTNIDTVRYTLD